MCKLCSKLSDKENKFTVLREEAERIHKKNIKNIFNVPKNENKQRVLKFTIWKTENEGKRNRREDGKVEAKICKLT